ncbi:hypothetical protein FB567DRAFT_603344 [Paraphoma chrysanthemicola]|uniref:BTB domain-containing protein n=1 Tax=Paraphoma chrysanthemicola TaxID=798071 RepID=A0A8K0VY48_9PLEO|nr:hypothetical protein FB567DRAFT_603344 [Paraphoma chrysanthemicola]
MSNPANPCKHPWTPLTYSKSDEVVNVRITKSTRVQDYELHVPILRHYSGYFRTKLSETNGAGRRPDVILEVDSPAAFDAFTIWLYQGTLTRAVFGLRSDTPALQNAVVDKFVARLISDDAVPYDIVAYLETHALDSKLDELILDIVKHCGKKGEMKDWAASFSPASFQKVYVWKGEKTNVVEYLEGKIVCGKWHVHPEADERDGDVFWFDPPVRKAGGLQ